MMTPSYGGELVTLKAEDFKEGSFVVCPVRWGIYSNIHVTDDCICFEQWVPYLANHPRASNIFRAPTEGFHAEAFPEEEPNSEKLENKPLRVDFVCTRVDGNAVRLHPEQSREPGIIEGRLEYWRSLHVFGWNGKRNSKEKEDNTRCESLTTLVAAEWQWRLWTVYGNRRSYALREYAKLCREA
jgi:hypothetical protein